MQQTVQTFYDSKQNRYVTTEQLDYGTGWVCLSTDNGHILKLHSQPLNKKALSSRVENLIKTDQASPLRKIIAYPTAILHGLKKKEFGYVCMPHTQSTLQEYTQYAYRQHHSTYSALHKWYRNTGDISYRLKIAYVILAQLDVLHREGICLIDICPANTFTYPYDSEKATMPIIQFGAADAISNCAYPSLAKGHAKYSDPLVYTGRSAPTSISDTYSCAVMLFELLTTFHPFIGEAVEHLNEQELATAIDKGEPDYIGDPEGNNYNENFDIYTQYTLSDELSKLFGQMFTAGKTNNSLRPSISEFKIAIRKTLYNIIDCACGHEYPYSDDLECPLCLNSPTDLVTAEVKKIISCAPAASRFANQNSDLQISELINTIVLRGNKLRYLSQGFFKLHTTIKKGLGKIAVCYLPDKKEVLIRNDFSEFSIKANGKTLYPHQKSTTQQPTEVSLPVKNDTEITIDLPDNILLDTQKTINIESPVFGTIRYKWLITIKRRSSL